MATARLASLLLAVLLADGAVAKSIPTYAGPYIFYPEKIYMCEGNVSTNEWPLRFHVSHFNPARPLKKPRLTGFVNATSVYDDRWWVNFEASKRSMNQWKPNAFLGRFPTAACTVLRTQAPGVFRAVYHEAGEGVMTGHAPCVLNVRSYRFDQEPTDMSLPNVPVLPYGQYRLTGQFGVGPQGRVKPKICLSAEGHVIPRP